MFDLVLCGGRVQGRRGALTCMDVAVRAGRIAALEADLSQVEALAKIHVDGALVTPGLTDLHCHVFDGATSMGIDPGEVSLRGGVTTLVDQGSCGSETARLFCDSVAARQDVGVLSFANLSRLGLTGITAAGELANPTYADPDGLRRLLAERPDVVRGVKVRLSEEATGGAAISFLRLARSVASDAGVPVCIHIGNSVEPIAELLGELASGDIVTHYQTPKRNGLVDHDLVLDPEARQARARGVLFDSGHGVTHFDFGVAAALLEQDFPPDVLSTDISRTSYAGLAPGLVTVMNKWLALGLPLQSVLEATTATPARVIGEDADGVVVGHRADLAVLALYTGDFAWADSSGGKRRGNRRLAPILTVRAGRIVWDGRATA